MDPTLAEEGFNRLVLTIEIQEEAEKVGQQAEEDDLHEMTVLQLMEEFSRLRELNSIISNPR